MDLPIVYRRHTPAGAEAWRFASEDEAFEVAYTDMVDDRADFVSIYNPARGALYTSPASVIEHHRAKSSLVEPLGRGAEPNIGIGALADTSR